MICYCGKTIPEEAKRGTIQITYAVGDNKRSVRRFVCSFICFADVLDEQARFVRLSDKKVDDDDVLQLATMLPARGGDA